MPTPTVICLTPVKNEAWILERFLECASIWADHIIVADQKSDDGSREIARAFPKVTLVENPSPTFNESGRQKILLEAARRITGPRLLIALDADEFLTANFSTDTEWNTILQAPAGTVFRFQWPIVLSNLCSYWMFPGEFAFGFMDDSSEHIGKDIHSPRLPTPAHARTVALTNIKVMHFVATDVERWRSKLRWYQCWQMLNQPERPLTEIYRFNHKDLNIPSDRVKAMPKEWLLGYEQQGIDMSRVVREGIYRWDKEILQLFDEYGPDRFRRVAIWDVNWSELRRKINGNETQAALDDPRSRFDKYVHRWLERTQPFYSHYARRPLYLKVYFRLVHNTLRLFGW